MIVFPTLGSPPGLATLPGGVLDDVIQLARDVQEVMASKGRIDPFKLIPDVHEDGASDCRIATVYGQVVMEIPVDVFVSCHVIFVYVFDGFSVLKGCSAGVFPARSGASCHVCICDFGRWDRLASSLPQDPVGSGIGNLDMCNGHTRHTRQGPINTRHQPRSQRRRGRDR